MVTRIGLTNGLHAIGSTMQAELFIAIKPVAEN